MAIRPQCEQLEPRHCLSAVAFVESVVAVHDVDVVHGLDFEQPLLTTADLDGDGDDDILAGLVDISPALRVVVAWYENEGGGQFGAQQVITTLTEDMWSLSAADLDGDGDVDLLSDLAEGVIVWFENTDGRGHFGDQQIIRTLPEPERRRIPPFESHAVDFDEDGDMDVLSIADFSNSCHQRPSERNCTSTHGQNIVLYQNAGDGQFGDRQVITFVPTDPELSVGIQDVRLADLDDDEDLDLLIANRTGDVIWYQNIGEGGFVEAQVLSDYFDPGYDEPNQIRAADLDRDGDLDILSAYNHPNETADLRWYENIDGRGLFSDKRPIADAYWCCAPNQPSWNALPGDFDGDGDLDVLSTLEGLGGWPTHLVWHENIDGAGTFDPRIVTRIWSLANRATDLDEDGRLDIIAVSPDKIVWYENRLIGDSNDDEIFDFEDLVAVFQAGKYNDDATFDEGDWNQDGRFDSGDLVLAFQAGHYVAGAMPLEAEIAAAIDAIFDDDAD